MVSILLQGFMPFGAASAMWSGEISDSFQSFSKDLCLSESKRFLPRGWYSDWSFNPSPRIYAFRRHWIFRSIKLSKIGFNPSPRIYAFRSYTTGEAVTALHMASFNPSPRIYAFRRPHGRGEGESNGKCFNPSPRIYAFRSFGLWYCPIY